MHSSSDKQPEPYKQIRKVGASEGKTGWIDDGLDDGLLVRIAEGVFVDGASDLTSVGIDERRVLNLIGTDVVARVGEVVVEVMTNAVGLSEGWSVSTIVGCSVGNVVGTSDCIMVDSSLNGGSVNSDDGS